MKILFLYRYGILGGVCTQLFHRFRHVSSEFNYEIHCGFRSDHGVKEMLGEYATIHFNLNKETTVTFLNENKFDMIIVIDSEEYIEALREVDHGAIVLVEVHTSIERNLQYLSRIEPSDIDAFVTVSDYMITRIKHYIKPELMDIDINIFQNVLDSNLFQDIEIETNGPPVIAWVGKIDDHKDWKAFMKICKLVREKNTDAEYWIIGGQTCPEDLSQEVFDFAEETGIISRFRWIDRIENVKMPSLYSLVAKRGGLSLVTSHCESFGMSVLESLLTGCPVVSTNVGALPEITSPAEYYRLYELHQYREAAEACIEMMDNSKHVNNALEVIRTDLVEQYDSSLHSIEYWTMLKGIGE